MTIRHYASLGSVSTGTLRTEDLLRAFADDLEDHVRANRGCHGLGLAAKRKLIREARIASECYEAAEADEVLEQIQEALAEFAPPYCYFGAHVGDGADFGFWPEPGLFDSDDILPRFRDEPPADFRGDCAIINDHGNATVGYVNGRGKFIAIWDCV